MRPLAPSLLPHLTERFIRSSGPGGQNVNKVATAVELRLDVRSAPLPEAVKTRLRALAGGRMTDDDVLVIDSREHRSQARNREAAVERLAGLLRLAAVRPKKRRATKPTAGAREGRLSAKHRRAGIKRDRGARSSDDE